MFPHFLESVETGLVFGAHEHGGAGGNEGALLATADLLQFQLVIRTGFSAADDLRLVLDACDDPHRGACRYDGVVVEPERAGIVRDDLIVRLLGERIDVHDVRIGLHFDLHIAF